MSRQIVLSVRGKVTFVAVKILFLMHTDNMSIQVAFLVVFFTTAITGEHDCRWIVVGSFK